MQTFNACFCKKRPQGDRHTEEDHKHHVKNVISLPFTHCKIDRVSGLSKIQSILKKVISIDCSQGILIGSRAARIYLPNLRGLKDEPDADWNIIGSANYVLWWLNKTTKSEIDTIEMLIPTSNDNELDLNLYCTIKNKSKFHFSIPRSLSSYTAYLLNQFDKWIITRDDLGRRSFWIYETFDFFKYGSSKLLLILKKYMLYYSYQWEKSAKDYRELLTVTDSLTDEDQILIDMVINYNERFYGKRPLDTDEFTLNSSDTQKNVTINRNKFFQQTKDEQITIVYDTITQLLNFEDILIGFKYICTQGPLWLADYILNNWIDIQHEKYKKFVLPMSSIKFDTNEYQLFDQLPECITQKIFLNLTNTLDFYSMKFVCKKWYNLLQQESFWRNLYLYRFRNLPPFSAQVKSWKLFYFIRLEEKQIVGDRIYIEDLIDATIQLRKFTANDVLQLWETLTHQDQIIEPDTMTKINHILSNSYYYFMENTGEYYFVKLIVIGLEHPSSRSNVILNLTTNDDLCYSCTLHIKELFTECISDLQKQGSSKLSGPDLFGFTVKPSGYSYTHTNRLTQAPSTFHSSYPAGIIFCLFIMMTHPFYRTDFIEYLKRIENYCAMNCIDGP